MLEQVTSAVTTMEINQLLSFFQIVQTGSFSKASERVFKSQSAVSHQITNLEKELKVKLLERLGRSVRLTQEGKTLFNLANNFFYELDNLKGIFEDIQHSKIGNLSIVTNNAVIMYMLPKIIKTFKDEFPGVKLKLINNTIMSEIISEVLDGEADFAIGPKSTQGIPTKINFLFWKSFDRILIMLKNNPLNKKKAIELNDIAAYPLILYREGSVIRKDIEEAFVRNNLPCHLVMETDVAESIKKYVEIGIGVSILSSLTITKKDKVKFVLRNVNHLFGSTDYGIYYRPDKYITAAMKQFIKIFSPELYHSLSPPDPKG